MSAEDQSTTRIVQSELGVKSWAAHLPSVEEARPGRCPCCGIASRPVGAPLRLHGHGLRERDQWGPPAPGELPVTIGVQLRRYLCLECGAVIAVVPRGILRRRLYSAGAISWALALFGALRLPPAQVRARVSPWSRPGATAASGWLSLRRWAAAVQDGRLFPGAPRPAAEASLREVAARVAAALAAAAPPGSTGSLDTLAFAGAAHVS